MSTNERASKGKQVNNRSRPTYMKQYLSHASNSQHVKGSHMLQQLFYIKTKNKNETERHPLGKKALKYVFKEA